MSLKIEPDILKDETERLSLNVLTNHESTLRNIPEERRSYLNCGGGLKSRKG